MSIEKTSLENESQPSCLAAVSSSLPSPKDIQDAIFSIRNTYEDLVSGDTYPIDEWSAIAKNLKYALRKLGYDC